ncbi:NAD(P)-dependent oxidoreductase [Sphingomonas sp. Leaf4]|uniref:NAD(P)-dependent oxidoreductase n=1 Tax=Sphingomonas sp. Leaf4 TaxID=2876553 RepID=UPI001E2C1BFE|nr:NAD(P)-dependent oxidoreductase [Sphingomonas sp. Leaf4]
MRLLIFGMGYTARAIADRLEPHGWRVAGTTRDGRDGTIAFADHDRVAFEARAATAILSSIPPDADGDPVLNAYRDLLGGPVLAYLSSTGVYGDAGGGWVDEASPIAGRRANRNAADVQWLAMGARVFRLPGIYGPGRSPLDRVAEGKAHRVDLPDQVFSRIHVADIADGVARGLTAPAGAYNLADDLPCSQNEVVAYAAALLGLAPPPFVALETLSPMARAFYAENRRVANGKARRVLGWTPAYPDYRFGLRALSATTSPASASAAPAPASSDHR